MKRPSLEVLTPFHPPTGFWYGGWNLDCVHGIEDGEGGALLPVRSQNSGSEGEREGSSISLSLLPVSLNLAASSCQVSPVSSPHLHRTEVGPFLLVAWSLSLGKSNFKGRESEDCVTVVFPSLPTNTHLCTPPQSPSDLGWSGKLLAHHSYCIQKEIWGEAFKVPYWLLHGSQLLLKQLQLRAGPEMWGMEQFPASGMLLVCDALFMMLVSAWLPGTRGNGKGTWACADETKYLNRNHELR